MIDFPKIQEGISDEHFDNPLHSPLWLFRYEILGEHSLMLYFYSFIEDLSQLQSVDLDVRFVRQKAKERYALRHFTRVDHYRTMMIVQVSINLGKKLAKNVDHFSIAQIHTTDVHYVYTHRDFAEFREVCHDPWLSLVAMRERERPKAGMLRKHRKWLIISLSSIIAVSLVAYLFIGVIFKRDLQYAAGQKYLTQANYPAAIRVFTQLGDFKQSAGLLQEAQYHYAKVLFETGDYYNAYLEFAQLDTYQDSVDQKNEAYYQYCLTLVEAQKTDEAIVGFTALGSYKDSVDQLHQLQYQQANALVASGDLLAGANAYKALGNYQDADKLHWTTLDRYLEQQGALPTSDYQAGLNELYNGLLAYSTDPDVMNRLLSDRYWLITLPGQWRSSVNDRQFNVTLTEAGTLSVTHNLTESSATGSLKFADGSIFIVDSSGTETRWIDLSLQALNQMTLFNHQSNEAYSFTK